MVTKELEKWEALNGGLISSKFLIQIDQLGVSVSSPHEGGLTRNEVIYCDLKHMELQVVQAGHEAKLSLGLDDIQVNDQRPEAKLLVPLHLATPGSASNPFFRGIFLYSVGIGDLIPIQFANTRISDLVLEVDEHLLAVLDHTFLGLINSALSPQSEGAYRGTGSKRFLIYESMLKTLNAKDVHIHQMQADGFGAHLKFIPSKKDSPRLPNLDAMREQVSEAGITGTFHIPEVRLDSQEILMTSVLVMLSQQQADILLSQFYSYIAPHTDENTGALPQQCTAGNISTCGRVRHAGVKRKLFGVKRSREPRKLGLDRSLQVMASNLIVQDGKKLLGRLRGSWRLGKVRYIFHYEAKNQGCLLTDQRVVVYSIPAHQVEWHLPLDSVEKVVMISGTTLRVLDANELETATDGTMAHLFTSEKCDDLQSIQSMLEWYMLVRTLGSSNG